MDRGRGSALSFLTIRNVWKFWPIKRAQTVFLNQKTPLFAHTQNNHVQLTAEGVVGRGFNTYGQPYRKILFSCFLWSAHFGPFSAPFDPFEPYLMQNTIFSPFWGQISRFSATPAHFLGKWGWGFHLWRKKICQTVFDTDTHCVLEKNEN